MPCSFSLPVDFSCPECSENVSDDLWIIVDTSENPELLEKIKDGSIRTVVCPQCGGQSSVDAPLLAHQPDRQKVYFVAPQNTSHDQDREIIGDLMQRLTEEYEGEAPGYLKTVIPIPREYLFDVLAAENPDELIEKMKSEADEAIKQLPPHVQNMLQRLDQLDPEVRTELLDVLQNASSPDQLQEMLNDRPQLKDVFKQLMGGGV